MQESHYLTCADCGQENGADSKFCRICGSALATGAPVPLTCADCGQENEAGSKFCRACGSALATGAPAPLTCADCGQENGADSKFCRACGSALATGAPAPLTCADCGQENEAGSKFCRGCGSALATGGSARAAGAPPPSLVCPRCLHGNEPESQFCYNCGLPLAGERGHASTAPPGLQAFASGRPAGFWVRAGGLAVDMLVGMVLFALALESLTDSSLGEYFGAGYGGGAALDLDSSLGEYVRAMFVGGGALHLDLINYVMGFGYATLLVGAFGTTVGKRPFNLYILRPDGTRVGYGRALGREAARFLSSLLLGAGFLWVLFRADKRALHDLIADTVVIRR